MVVGCCRVLLRLECVDFGWGVVLITLFWVLFWWFGGAFWFGVFDGWLLDFVIGYLDCAL